MSDETTNPFLGRKRDNPGEVVPVDSDPLARDEYTEPSSDEVPAGTTKEVLDWVGDDEDRARRALDAEEAKGDNGRKGLERELNKKLGN